MDPKNNERQLFIKFEYCHLQLSSSIELIDFT